MILLSKKKIKGSAPRLQGSTGSRTPTEDVQKSGGTMWIYADQAWLSLQAFKIGRIALVVNLGNTSNRGSIGGGGAEREDTHKNSPAWVNAAKPVPSIKAFQPSQTLDVVKGQTFHLKGIWPVEPSDSVACGVRRGENNERHSIGG